MIQKILCVLLASLLPLMALAEHNHTPGEWDRDGENHWQVCACGEKMNVAPHILEDVLCAECQSEVWRYEDGAADVYNYDEHLEIVRSTFYSPQGQAEYDYRYVNTYDEQGVKAASQTWLDGTLVEETRFAPDADGFPLPVKTIAYEADGVRHTNEYNEIGAVVRSQTFMADGTLIAEENITYFAEEEGGGYLLTGFMEGGATYRTEYNGHGDCTFNGFYEADGTAISEFRMEYEYDAEGNRIHDKTYAGERLISENTYVNGYAVSSVEYEEDGSRYVYEYDDRGNTLKHTLYDARGNIQETKNYDAQSDTLG